MATRRKSTKTSAKVSTPAEQTAVQPAPTPTTITPEQAAEANAVTAVKKKELIEKVAEVSGVKKGDTKKVMEALFKEMGDILQDGGELNVPPLGKLSVNRVKEAPNAYVLITKLRRSKNMLADKPDAPEDSVLSEGSAVT